MRSGDLRAAALALSALCVLAGCNSRTADGSDRSVSAESRLRVAAASETAGYRDMAASSYAEAARAAPEDGSVQVQAAEGLARTGKREDAARVLARRLAADPKDIAAGRALGEVQILSGRPEQAVATLTAVLAARPDDIGALGNKGVALDLLNRHAEAQQLYRRALALAPGDATISNDLALSQMLSGHLDDARRTLEPFRGASGVPNRIAINLAILDAAAGRSDIAGPVLEGRVVRADPASLADAIRQAPVMSRLSP